ncbi:hypothetical protein GP5015_1982 [gamma proteobacterium HTCC5015]|nr:hypothetical protein GP5015_1982 [gamma proteobacterium HTCC5015]
MAPALRVVAKKAPLVVARRSFGFTKPRSLRLDWRFFCHNSDNQIRANRPWSVLPVLTGLLSL